MKSEANVWSAAASAAGPIFTGGRLTAVTGKPRPPGKKPDSVTSRPRSLPSAKSPTRSSPAAASRKAELSSRKPLVPDAGRRVGDDPLPGRQGQLLRSSRGSTVALSCRKHSLPARGRASPRRHSTLQSPGRRVGDRAIRGWGRAVGFVASSNGNGILNKNWNLRIMYSQVFRLRYRPILAGVFCNRPRQSRDLSVFRH